MRRIRAVIVRLMFVVSGHVTKTAVLGGGKGTDKIPPMQGEKPNGLGGGQGADTAARMVARYARTSHSAQW